MNVVYLVFGKQLAVHQQANFSILTLLANGGDFDNIIVITDAPEYYQNIQTDKLVIELVNAKTLTEWKGVHNYVLRVKIKALQFIIGKYPNESLLFLDADTYVLQQLNTIKNQLNNGYYLLHLNEGRIAESNRNTQKRIWKAIKGKAISNVKIVPNLCMWNSGVIGIPSFENKMYIEKVLLICDALYPSILKHRLVEQLSFSITLQLQEKFAETEKEIGHYWGNKDEWNGEITSFFLNNHLKKNTFKQEIEAISSFDLHKTPVFVKKSNTAKRLKQLVDKIF